MQLFYESAKKRKEEGENKDAGEQGVSESPSSSFSRAELGIPSSSKRSSTVVLTNFDPSSRESKTSGVPSSKNNSNIQNILNKVNIGANSGGISRGVGGTPSSKGEAQSSHKDIEQDIYARLEKKNLGAGRAGKPETQNKIMEIIKKNKNN